MAFLFLIIQHTNKVILTRGVLAQAVVPATNDVDNDDASLAAMCSVRTAVYVRESPEMKKLPQTTE